MNKLIEDAWGLHESAFCGKADKQFGKTIIKDHDCCKVHKEERRVYFLFEPTSDLKDWISNLNASESSENQEFHQGFKLSAERFYNQIKAIIYNNRPKLPHFYGFSRGGALAEYLAAKFAKEDKTLYTTCVTFGKPRVFKAEKAEEIEKLSNLYNYRVFFKNDIVQYLPFKLQGFRHLDSLDIELPDKWYYYFPFLSAKIRVHTKGYTNYFKKRRKVK